MRGKNIRDFRRNIGFSQDFHKEEIIHFSQLKDQDVPKFISNSEKKQPLQKKSPKSPENAICTPLSTKFQSNRVNSHNKTPNGGGLYTHKH